MNITNFEYGNYFGTYHFKDVPEKVNVLLTPNGKGKTTYISALKQALMGDNKSDEQIQKGYTASFTRIMVNGNDIFREKKAGANQKLKVNSKTTTQKSLNQLYESYGVYAVETIIQNYKKLAIIQKEEKPTIVISSEKNGSKTLTELASGTTEDFFNSRNLNKDRDFGKR